MLFLRRKSDDESENANILALEMAKTSRSSSWSGYENKHQKGEEEMGQAGER